MFNNQTLSDVTFVVQASRSHDNETKPCSGPSMYIPAHKSLLAIRSPVFFAMFCGKMAKAETNEIYLPDCEYQSLLEFFRFVYTDQVCLTGGTIMQVLYLAEKFMIPHLLVKCIEYILKILDHSNVLCVLKHAELYGFDELICACWELIDKEAREVLNSDDFLTIERSLLEEVVERNLNVKSAMLFKAVDRWAKQECLRENLKPDGKVKRSIIGDRIAGKLRFPVEKDIDFINVVLQSNILTEIETSEMLKYYQLNIKE